MSFLPLKLAAALCLAGALLPTAGFAIEAGAFEQAELAQLQPELRAQVEARLAAGGQTVRGILDTMLLNSISLKFATGKLVAVDWEKGVAVADGADGQLHVVPFDAKSLALTQ